MNRSLKRWLPTIAITCSCVIAPHDLFAAVSLSTTSNAVSIPFATTDYNSSTGAAQVIKTSAHSVTVTATGGAWRAFVKTATATFSFVPSSGDPNPNKPAGDLAIRVPALGATWFVLSTTNQLVANLTGTVTGTVDYRLDSNLATNPPGTYSIAVIYTVTQP
jgi:hypothetical protein